MPRAYRALVLALALLCAAIATAHASEPHSLSFVDEQAAEHLLTQSDLDKLPRTKATVTDHGGKPAEYEGVELDALLNAEGVKLGKELRGPRIASYLLVEANDGYQVVLAIAEADPATSGRTALLADKKNGLPLPETEGPWRLILPDDKRPVRWIRMVKRISIHSAIPSAKSK